MLIATKDFKNWNILISIVKNLERIKAREIQWSYVPCSSFSDAICTKSVFKEPHEFLTLVI